MRYGKINEAIWGDKKFNSCSDSARLLYMYLLSCSKCNSIGIFQIGMGLIEDEFGHERSVIKALIAELDAADLLRYENNWIWFNKYLRWNEPTSPNHARRCANDLNDVVMKSAPKEAVCNFLGSVRPILSGLKVKNGDKTYYDDFKEALDFPLVGELVGGEDTLKRCLRDGVCGLNRSTCEALQKDLASTSEVLGNNNNNKYKDNNNTSTQQDNTRLVGTCKSKEPSEVSLYCSDGLPLAVGQSAVSLALARFSEDERHRVIIEAQKKTINAPIERGTQDNWFISFASGF